MLDNPVDEAREQLRILAEKGLVKLKDAWGEVKLEHVEDLVPEDRARVRGAWIAWPTQRSK